MRRRQTGGADRVLPAAAGLLLVGFAVVGCAPEASERLEWTTMGTIAAVQWRPGGAASGGTSVRATEAVRREFAAVERLLNAHDPASELRRLAPLGEGEILARCDRSVSNCYATAFRLMRETGGAFNPRWRGSGTMDLGAIAKGFAVDRAAAALDGVAEDILVDLGGNLKSVRGAWRIGIAASNRTLSLTNGMACATSAEYFRGKHIRDGRTGNAVSNDLVSVTVVHPTSAMLADGLTTALFVLGPRDGARFLETHYPEARAIWHTRAAP